MKIIVQFRDGRESQKFSNADGVQVGGQVMIVGNESKAPIAIIPIEVVRCVLYPENDSPIVRI